MNSPGCELSIRIWETAVETALRQGCKTHEIAYTFFVMTIQLCKAEGSSKEEIANIMNKILNILVDE